MLSNILKHSEKEVAYNLIYCEHHGFSRNSFLNVFILEEATVNLVFSVKIYSAKKTLKTTFCITVTI